MTPDERATCSPLSAKPPTCETLLEGGVAATSGPTLLSQTVDHVMTGDHRPSRPTCSARPLEFLNHAKITTLFMVESDRPVGIVHLHDFLRTGWRDKVFFVITSPSEAP
jgi:hypothetical protein